jgi:hypothetical protein
MVSPTIHATVSLPHYILARSDSRLLCSPTLQQVPENPSDFRLGVCGRNELKLGHLKGVSKHSSQGGGSGDAPDDHPAPAAWLPPKTTSSHPVLLAKVLWWESRVARALIPRSIVERVRGGGPIVGCSSG